jgi:cell division protein FtsB
MRDANGLAWPVSLALLVLTIVTVPLLLVSPQAIPRYRALRDELGRVDEKNARLEREIKELQTEIQQLRDDPRALERLARDELGMVRDGEVVFQFAN